MSDELVGKAAAAVSEAMQARSEHRDAGPTVFTGVRDRDLVTLTERFVGPFEYRSMLVAAQLMVEVDRRGLWDAVVERRVDLLTRAHPDERASDLGERARTAIERFRGEHFPVEPDAFDSAAP